MTSRRRALYRRGSVIQFKESHPRRYEVLGQEGDHYVVRALFSGQAPNEFLWPVESCDAHTKLEWQKPAITTVHDPSKEDA